MKAKSALLLLALPFIPCGCKEYRDNESIPSQPFARTWNAGKAEISSFELQQARYGEIRSGEATLIFVTEDFSTKNLVKLDDPGRTGNKVRVLKMNMTKNFITGIYPYSMMLSVFKPVSADANSKALKINCSSQEWCGQTFSQLQLNENQYDWQLHSYFEKEVEQEKKLRAALPEDELWTRIRINPSTLPVGKHKVIPGLLWQRLSHTAMQEEDALMSLEFGGNFLGSDSALRTYTIQYPAVERVLRIYFQTAFPHAISGWEESYPDGFGTDKKILITKAVLKKTIWLDYWKHNANKDTIYRNALQLRQYE